MSTVRFVIDTIDDLALSDKITPLFDYFKILIADGYELEFYRSSTDDECLTTIRDNNHLINFRRSLQVDR